MEKVFIPVLLGTAREGRASENVANYVHGVLKEQEGVETELIDVRDHVYTVTTPPWGEVGADKNPTPWKAIAKKANGFIFVLPEYNHGYPGEFKLLIDSIYDEYAKKPVTICGVSAGIFGGSRLIDNIKPVLVELKMVPTRGAIYFGKAKEAFDQSGNIIDESQKERVEGTLEELLWYARALKGQR